MSPLNVKPESDVMNGFQRILIAILPVAIVVYVLVARTSALAEWFRLIAELDWTNRPPVLRAASPQEAPPASDLPADFKRPLVIEQQAILIDPSNGREMVDRIVSGQTPEWPVPAQRSTAAKRRPIGRLLRSSPYHLLPFAAGS